MRQRHGVHGAAVVQVHRGDGFLLPQAPSRLLGSGVTAGMRDAEAGGPHGTARHHAVPCECLSPLGFGG